MITVLNILFSILPHSYEFPCAQYIINTIFYCIAATYNVVGPETIDAKHKRTEIDK